MKDRINTFFSALSKGQQWRPSNKGKKNDVEDKLYEIYTYILVATEIKKKCLLVHRNGSNPNTIVKSSFVFRGSPTNLHNPDYSYLEFQKKNGNKTKYELHLSLEINGSSGINHEMDICIVDHLAARSATGFKQYVDYQKVPITLECKKYTSKIEKSLGREVLGMNLDTGRTKTTVKLDGYFIYNYKKIDQQILDLLSHYNVIPLYISPNGQDHKNNLRKHISDFVKSI